jgi:hypothetical protein
MILAGDEARLETAATANGFYRVPEPVEADGGF